MECTILNLHQRALRRFTGTLTSPKVRVPDQNGRTRDSPSADSFFLDALLCGTLLLSQCFNALGEDTVEGSGLSKDQQVATHVRLLPFIAFFFGIRRSSCPSSSARPCSMLLFSTTNCVLRVTFDSIFLIVASFRFDTSTPDDLSSSRRSEGKFMSR